MKLELSRQIFEENLNIKCHQNPSSGSRVVPCGQTDMKLFSILWTRLKWILEKWVEGTEWIELAQDRDRWWTLVKAVMNYFPINPAHQQGRIECYSMLAWLLIRTLSVIFLSNPSDGEIFRTRPDAQGPTQPPIQWVPILIPGSKASGLWRRPPTPHLAPRLKKE
jgi:hypothetical protein